MIRELKDYSEFELKQWGSHTEVIVDHIMKKEKISTMIELGAGDFSTPIYALKVDQLFSIETNLEWFSHVQQKYNLPNVRHIFLDDKDIPQWLEATFSMIKVDLVLVDHTHETVENQRALVSNQLMKLGCKHVVIHDICDSIQTAIDADPNYNFFVNSKSINPSLYIQRK